METYPKIEVGYAVGKGDSAFLIGQETARNALSSIGKHATSAVLVFASVSYDLEEVLKGIGSIVSDVTVLGTTTAGEVCNGLYEESVVVVALASPHLKMHCALGNNVSQDWQMAVEQTINSPEIAPFFQNSPFFWQELTRRGKTVFAVLFTPGNTRVADTRSYEILEELKRRTLGRIPIFGGASGDDWRLAKNYVLLGQKAFPDSILLAIFETELQIGIAIGNGFQPSSFQATVNSVEGHEILTMDGRPSAEVFAQALGMSPESLEGKHLTLTSGHAFGISDPMEEYAINVASYTTPRGGIRFTQPVLPGTLFTLMSSQSEDMLCTGKKVLRKALLRGGITDPACVLVCYCALRPRLLGKDAEKEIRLMMDAIDGIPLVGFCSFGEQGVSDAGLSRHDNASVTALIFGHDLSYAANVAIENDVLQKKLLQQADDLETRVEERTNELRLANLMLEQDITKQKQADEDLRQSLSLLRATLESTADGILVVNSSGKITASNARFAEMWRLPSEILSSLNDEQAIEFVLDQLKDPNVFIDKIEQLYDQPEKESFDVLEFKDGRVFERYSKPQRINDHFVGRVWSFRDVTERRQADVALRERELQLSTAAQIAHLGYWEYKVPDDQFTFNDHFYAMLHTTAEQVGGYMMSSAQYAKLFVHPDDMNVLGSEIRKVLDASDPQYCSQLEHRIIYADGGIGYVTVCIYVVKDDQGQTIRTYGVNQDITERKQTEEALRVAEKKFRDLLETIQLVAILLDREGNITFCNDYLQRLTGWAKGDLLGRNWVDLFIPRKQKEQIKKVFSLVISGDEEHLHYENNIMTREGAELLISWNNTLLHDLEGKVSGTASIGINITEQRNLEAQLRQSQKMEAVGQLAGGIAHDFNNILSAIVGYAYLLQSRMSSDDPSKDDVEQILESAQRAAEVTHSLLAFSKKQSINLKPVLINDVVKRSVKLLSRVIGENITINTSFSGNEVECMADAAQIEQVLMNIATNARDAMPLGGKLTFSTECVTMDDSFIRDHGYGRRGMFAMISVSDTGVGMSKETTAKIYEPFFTTKETGKGTGLGLAMVYGIIKQHDGYIDVLSEQGKGTTFNIYLPAAEAKKEVTVTTIESLPSGGTETILVAEDDEKLRNLYEIILQQQGYEVILAQDGQAGLEKFIENKNKIHLVILDMIMPKKSGKEVHDQIMRIKPNVKVIFVSGHTADRIDKESLVGENVGFIFKPASPQDLLRKVRDMLDD